MAERKLTIARALTRLKTIDAQLTNITADLKRHAVGVSNRLSGLSQAKKVEASHKEAKEKVASLYQSFKDLVDEKNKIRAAISRTNQITTIEVAGKTLTIQEALFFEKEGKAYYQMLIEAYQHAERAAEHLVGQAQATQRNDQVVVPDVTKIDFLGEATFQEIRRFVTEFTAEINGVLNEVNAITELEL